MVKEKEKKEAPRHHGARASVMAVNPHRPEQPLLSGEIEIEIGHCEPFSNEDGSITGVYAHCYYPVAAGMPDGFSRDHQVASIEELIPKIVNNLRSRYGCNEVTVLAAPSKVAEGGTIKLGV